MPRAVCICTLWSARMFVLALGIGICKPIHAGDTPIAGFQPLVGIGLTDEFKDANSDGTFFFSDTSLFPGGSWLNRIGEADPYFDVALLDTGAGASLITAAAHEAFDLDGNGFDGTVQQRLGGATGFFFAEVSDPLGIYAAGLADRTSTSPLAMSPEAMAGTTSVSILTLPEDSDLPNVLGLTFASQYATVIHSDQPEIFQLDGRTVRTPHVDFQPLGSGGMDIVRRAPLTLNPSDSFLRPPIYIYNLENVLSGEELTEDPQNPTNVQGGLFLNVDVANAGEQIENVDFFFDTGADVTVVSQLNAVRLGFDPILDEPDFTIPVLGSGGTLSAVPGFFADELTVATIGGAFTATNVPIIALDVTDPSSPGNIVPGIVGTNVFAGRNLVIDPVPSIGGGGVGPSLYISDPVTTELQWASTAQTATWSQASSWTQPSVPDSLSATILHNVSGDDQVARIQEDSVVWDMRVSGSAESQIAVQVDAAATLTTFSGIVLEPGGGIRLAGGAVDTHYVEILGGFLSGEGGIRVGNGPIPGQVENRDGTVSPGQGIGQLNIQGLFANRAEGLIEIELGGTSPGTQYDQLIVEGAVELDGLLQVQLVDGFVPQDGNVFTLLTATDELVGEFQTLALPGDYQWDISYEAHSVILSVAGLPLVGDFNLDGAVDAVDAALMVSEWATAGSVSDLSGDGIVDALDAGIMIANWTGDAAVQAVPEPGLLVVWMCLALTCLRTVQTRQVH